MSLIPRKSRLVKNAEVINGNKRDMRKKVIKSTTKDSDLKRAITKRANGGLASFIELEETPISFTPTEFSEYNFPLSNTYIDIKQKEQPVEFEEESTTSSKYVPLTNDKKQSSTIPFDKLIDEVSQGNESVKNLKKFLTDTARVESNFDFKVQNKAGAPAYGAFQFMDFNIKPLGVSIEEFRNNPRLQIEAAAKLAEQFKSQFTEEDRRLAKEKGYSENALLAGAWLGGVGGVRKVLRGEGNPSDKHWSKEEKGTTVKDRMDKFNKMQEGGVLKCQTGDKFIIPEYGSEKDFDEFILINEKFKPKTYRDAKGKLTLGYGLRQTYDEDLNPTPVKLGQTITEEEARIQHERRKQLDMRQIKKRLPNFDLYPKGLQYAIRDMVFNSGETSTFNPNTKFMKALKAYDSSGDYSNWDSVKGIAKHIDWNLDTEGNLGVRAGMRRAMATEIYDWNDNETIGKYHTNPKDKNYYVNSPYWQFGQLNPKTKGNKIKSRQLGGVLKCQDGKKVDPTILEYWKKQNVVLPEPRHEQVNVDNRTKELKEAQEKDANTKKLGNNLKQFGIDTRNQLGTMLSYVNPSFGLALGLGDAGISTLNGNYIEGGI